MGFRRSSLCCVLAACVALAFAASAQAANTACGPAKADATTRLTVIGNKLEDGAGNVVMPYGVSVVGGPQTVNWTLTEDGAAAQITAAHDYWHANTIRFQVSEALLFRDPTPGRSYNATFAQAVDRLLCQIIRQGDIPVLNDTTIFTGRERGPGPRTLRFWRFMAKRYGNDLPVIFDLFNEPQVTRNPRTGRFFRHSDVWRIWRSGGKVGRIRYLGMQDLVSEIRYRQHVHNVIWVEEPYYVDFDGGDLALLPSYALKGGDVQYTFHKPDMRQSSRSFRDLQTVANQGVPLVNSEWSQFAATDRPWMCQSDAYRTAPRYLQFLRDSGIGMLAWSLQPGSLVKGQPGVDTVNDGAFTGWTTNPADLSQPSQMDSSYGCTEAARGQGVGELAMDYFARYSARPPASLFPTFS